jgi:hypothetical protein
VYVYVYVFVYVYVYVYEYVYVYDAIDDRAELNMKHEIGGSENEGIGEFGNWGI